MLPVGTSLLDCVRQVSRTDNAPVGTIHPLECRTCDPRRLFFSKVQKALGWRDDSGPQPRVGWKHPAAVKTRPNVFSRAENITKRLHERINLNPAQLTTWRLKIEHPTRRALTQRALVNLGEGERGGRECDPNRFIEKKNTLSRTLFSP